MYQDPWPVDELIDRLGIDAFSRTSVRRLSGGQKQRLALAAALVGNPEVLFLDEPSAGLDPQSRQMVFELISELRNRGMGIVLTTHLMDDAQRLADYVYIIDAGRNVAEGTVAQLLQHHLPPDDRRAAHPHACCFEAARAWISPACCPTASTHRGAGRAATPSPVPSPPPTSPRSPPGGRPAASCPPR